MNPIRRLGFFAYAMLHMACWVLLVLYPIVPWSVGFAARMVGALLLISQFFRLMGEAIKDGP